VTTREPVRWGFLGAGFVASRGLAPAVHAADGAVLQASRQDEHRAAALEPVRATTSYAEVCTADDVDAVYLSLPNDDHLPWVLEALAAGKQVLCEKPLGLDAAQVARMAAAAESADRLLVEASWNRWHPRTRRVEALLADVAGPLDVRAWFTFPGVPADTDRLDPGRGGGALLDVGCYAVAAALIALGDDATVTSVERHVAPQVSI
jgi:predicted dehydrogenase